MVSKLRALTKKQIALAVVAMSLFGTVGAVSVSQAAPAGKPTKQQCAQMGFSNYGQCVKVWGQGHGYAGFGHSVKTESFIHKVEHSWAFSWFSW